MKRTAIVSFSQDGEYKITSLNTALFGVGYKYKDDAAKEILKSFGWDGATSDQNKYFPDEDADSVLPKDSDFMNIPFRLLSATIVGAHTWKATDFTDVKVLKKATKLLEKKPIYKDHDTHSVDNVVGMVGKTKFAEPFQDGNLKIPAGIDGVLKIDAKTNPKLARNVYIGAVDSNSVTVLFDWEPSHEFEDDWEFERNLGRVIDGNMVTRKVTKIIDFYETSLVWVGADPYAKKHGEDGKPESPDTPNVFEDEDTLVKDMYYNESFYRISCKSDKSFVNCTRKFESSKSFNKSKLNKMNASIAKKLIELFGVEKIDEVTPDMLIRLSVKDADADADADALNLKNAELINGIAELSIVEEGDDIIEGIKTLQAKVVEIGQIVKDKEELAEQVQTLTNKKVQLTEEKTSITAERDRFKLQAEENKEMAEFGKTVIEGNRTEVERLYKLTVDNKPNDAVLEIIKNATPVALEGLLLQYSQGMTEKFTGTCNDCNSQNITLRSTMVQEDNVNKDEEESISLDEIREKRLKTKRN